MSDSESSEENYGPQAHHYASTPKRVRAEATQGFDHGDLDDPNTSHEIYRNQFLQRITGQYKFDEKLIFENVKYHPSKLLNSDAKKNLQIAAVYGCTVREFIETRHNQIVKARNLELSSQTNFKDRTEPNSLEKFKKTSSKNKIPSNPIPCKLLSNLNKHAGKNKFPDFGNLLDLVSEHQNSSKMYQQTGNIFLYSNLKFAYLFCQKLGCQNKIMLDFDENLVYEVKLIKKEKSSKYVFAFLRHQSSISIYKFKPKLFNQKWSILTPFAVISTPMLPSSSNSYILNPENPELFIKNFKISNNRIFLTRNDGVTGFYHLDNLQDFQEIGQKFYKIEPLYDHASLFFKISENQQNLHLVDTRTRNQVDFGLLEQALANSRKVGSSFTFISPSQPTPDRILAQNLNRIEAVLQLKKSAYNFFLSDEQNCTIYDLRCPGRRLHVYDHRTVGFADEDKYLSYDLLDSCLVTPKTGPTIEIISTATSLSNKADSLFPHQLNVPEKFPEKPFLFPIIPRLIDIYSQNTANRYNRCSPSDTVKINSLNEIMFSDQSLPINYMNSYKNLPFLSGICLDEKQQKIYSLYSNSIVEQYFGRENLGNQNCESKENEADFGNFSGLSSGNKTCYEAACLFDNLAGTNQGTVISTGKSSSRKTSKNDSDLDSEDLKLLEKSQNLLKIARDRVEQHVSLPRQDRADEVLKFPENLPEKEISEADLKRKFYGIDSEEKVEFEHFHHDDLFELWKQFEVIKLKDTLD